MAVEPPSILVILGPTASGKSALAMRVAERASAEILSVDSMQVYRGLDIGTAKPTRSERASVVHHLIDVADPNETFAVARFVELADAVIADAMRRGVRLVATGGTPLYYKSLFEGLFEGPAADLELRQALNARDLAELYAELKLVDPATSVRIHANDRRRIVRALEVYRLTGQPISSFQTEWAQPLHRHRAAWIGLSWEREALNRRINARVKSMLHEGWVAETESLLKKYGTLSRTAAAATGYHELIEYIGGRLPLDEAIEQIKIATRQLARRQMKWFRRFREVAWLDGSRTIDDQVNDVSALWPAAAR